MVIQGCGFEFCEFKSIDVRETLAWLIGIFSNHIPFSTPVPKSPAVLENFSLNQLGIPVWGNHVAVTMTRFSLILTPLLLHKVRTSPVRSSPL